MSLLHLSALLLLGLLLSDDGPRLTFQVIKESLIDDSFMN